MNSKGFSTILAVLLCLLLIPVLLSITGAISRSNQSHQIEHEIDSLNISAAVREKQCNGGDGIDSGAQCEYIYADNGIKVEAALKNAGFTSSGDGTMMRFTGGNPKLLIDVLVGSNGTTTLNATRLK